MSNLTLQLPDPVLDAARKLADRERISVEEYVSRMVADAVHLDTEWEQRVMRGRQITRERVREILAKAPDVPPIPGDEIEH